MKQYNITSWLGETIPFQVQWDTDIAATVTLSIYSDTGAVFSKSVAFIDKLAVLDITPAENISIGTGSFEWLIKVEYESGEIDILPDTSRNCALYGNCRKPLLVICEVVS